MMRDVDMINIGENDKDCNPLEKEGSVGIAL